MLTGGCHCGAIRYEATQSPINHALCHCSDCRRSVGAPMVGWAMFAADAVALTQGEPVAYHSSEHARRYFCVQCGTGLFYMNDVMLQGLVDVQSATLDDPDDLPAQVHIQTADRIAWMVDVHTLPSFERYPPQE